MTEAFQTRVLGAAADGIAPDGAEVRLLAATSRGGMAHLRLAAGAVSRAVKHRTVDDLWFVTAGEGELWRRAGADEATVPLKVGVSISIPAGTAFQFRATGGVPLEAVTFTTPPWPGNEEAIPVEGIWPVPR